MEKSNKKFISFILTTAVIFVISLICSLAGLNGITATKGFGAFVAFIFAFMPILLVMIGMMGFGLPGIKVAPFAFVLAVLESISFFANPERTGGETASLLWSNTWSGIISAIYIVGLILFSFLILNMMQYTGAMDIVKAAISRISGDRRVQIIIIGLFVPIFLEGAAGAGTPAAIAAPFMVGLGFNPIMAATIALMSDGVCTSFGGSGLTTLGGGAATVSAGISTIELNFSIAGWFHMFGILVMPFLILITAFGKNAFKGKGIVAYCLWCGVFGGLFMLIFSNFVGGFITNMGTGILGIVMAILGLKVIKIETPEELFFQIPKGTEKPKYSFIRALSPYVFILIIFPVVLTGSKYIYVGEGESRMALWNAIVAKVTYNGWIDILLFIISLLSIITLRMKMSEYGHCFLTALKKVVAVFIIMASLLAVANIMKITYQTGTANGDMSMIKLMAVDMAAVAGGFYPGISVLIGVLGSFITGTNLGANLLFAEMHMNAAKILGINQITTFAANNAGGSLGNMICPNNVTAACATVDVTGQEGAVMKSVAKMFLVCCVLYIVLALLYTYVVFPNLTVDSANLFSAIG